MGETTAGYLKGGMALVQLSDMPEQDCLVVRQRKLGMTRARGFGHVRLGVLYGTKTASENCGCL